MIESPLYLQLQQHRKKDFSPFHTPGHKGAVFFPDDLWRLDLTELPDTDALFEANGILRDCEERLASLFGAGRTLISCGGCTLAIQTMLCLASRKGKKILFARNIHRSAVNTAALIGIEPVWIMPQSEQGCFTGRITPGQVETALSEHPDITACYVTSPDYYGELTDIAGVAEVCHRHDVLLLVDNAHGSHLAFLSQNKHPIALGADMSACSLHKTLPVLTGGAVLNIRSAFHTAGAKETMALFGSTSPSYPIMTSIDWCCSYLRQGGFRDYAALEPVIREIKELAAAQGLVQPQGDCDPLRICLHTACAGLTGDRQITFCHDYGIEPEFCDGENIVCITTPFNTKRDFDRLKTMIRALSGNGTVPHPHPFPLPEQVLSPRAAVFSETEEVPLSKAGGRIAADSACPCPPGIPVVMPGERIHREALSRMLRNGGTGETIRCVKLRTCETKN